MPTASPTPSPDAPPTGPTKVVILASDVDSDGFVSIWSIASATCGGETIPTRGLAARLLIFLCKKKSTMVVTSSANASYLDSWLERDKKLLQDWKPESEFVDVVAQHAEVPADACLKFLDNEGFNFTSNYTATRAQRLEWFTEMWSVG
jgi:hypothetical protein